MHSNQINHCAPICATSCRAGLGALHSSTIHDHPNHSGSWRIALRAFPGRVRTARIPEALCCPASIPNARLDRAGVSRENRSGPLARQQFAGRRAASHSAGRALRSRSPAEGYAHDPSINTQSIINPRAVPSRTARSHIWEEKSPAGVCNAWRDSALSRGRGAQTAWPQERHFGSAGGVTSDTTKRTNTAAPHSQCARTLRLPFSTEPKP
jgi:hypothetical protein